MSEKLVILDLDETLIHATSEPKDRSWDFEVFTYKVYRRPFLDMFLSELKNHYRVAVWSSASDDYVEEIVKTIFPEDYPLEFVWGRSRCTQQYDYESIEEYGYFDQFNHLNYAKILKKVHRKGIARMEDMLIVDDTPRKSKYNYGNAIYPSEFNGEQDDNELSLLLTYLISIRDTPNFRTLEKRHWRSIVKGS